MMTSSPSSIKPMKALNMPVHRISEWTVSQLVGAVIPSFAPVVIVTSVSGFNCLPQCGEYASAIAFFSLGRPFVGEY
jgi:hypothetical protein